MPLSLELLNVGRSAVNIVEITPQSSLMDVEAQGLPFVGPLDAGGSAPSTCWPRRAGRTDLTLSWKSPIAMISTRRRSLAGRCRSRSSR